MKKSGVPKLVCFAVFVLTACLLDSAAQTFSVSVNFDANALNPEATLVEGFDGSLYGTSFAGGILGPCFNQRGCGTVYVLGGGFTTSLYSFCAQNSLNDCTDGSIPISPLFQANSGYFYGTTQGGNSSSQDPCGVYGCGTIFELVLGKPGITTLHTFSYTDGGVPTAGLIQGRDGNLYGTTTQGGANGNYGTLFRMTPAGNLTTLYNFCAKSNCIDGYLPSGPLLQAIDGSLYGVTAAGGANKNAGTVFKIIAPGKLVTLYSFCALTNCRDGVVPGGGLIQASDGNFYGTTNGGGTHNGGTVFRITPLGKLTTIYNFCSATNCADGSQPFTGVIQATDRNLYGITYAGGVGNRGTIFQITSTGKFTTLYSFCSQTNCSDGGYPMAGLVEDTSGFLDGVTSSGGLYGFGTGYNLSLGLSPFVRATPGFGKVGATITLTGPLYGATSVTFNGVPALFTVVGFSQISTTVPSNATSGNISVVTSVGPVTSAVAFRVIR